MLIALLGCGGAGESPAKPEQPAPPEKTATLSFAWPPDGVVAVTERVKKHNVELTLSYTLHLCDDEKGLRVRHRNIQVTAMTGVDLESEQAKKELAELRPIFEMTPDLIVSDSGEYQAMGNLDALLAALAQKYPHMAESFDRLKTDENARAQLESNVSELWAGWVGLWLRMDSAGGARQTIDGVTFERLESDGGLALRATKIWDPEVLRAAAMKSVPEETRPAIEKADIARTDIFEVTTDPSTLQPSRARRTQERRLVLPGEPPLQRKETNDYQFDWKSAAGQKAECH